MEKERLEGGNFRSFSLKNACAHVKNKPLKQRQRQRRKSTDLCVSSAPQFEEHMWKAKTTFLSEVTAQFKQFPVRVIVLTKGQIKRKCVQMDKRSVLVVASDKNKEYVKRMLADCK